jgi:hypothetical protein
MSNPLLLERRRSRLSLFFMPGLVLVLAVAWAGFWFYASGRIETDLDRWRDREARSGRLYECADRNVGGFPFRLELRCDGVNVSLTNQTADQAQARTAATARLGSILVVSQIYDPKRIIAEFTGPLSLGERGAPPTIIANWKLARASVYGLPENPERASFAADDPAIDRIGGAMQVPVLRAKHLEIHGRVSDGSIKDNPALDLAFNITGGSAGDVHPVLAAPFDAEWVTTLRGLKDLAPKPWPERFREIAANGGRIELLRSRLQQGDLLAIAAGSLSLTPQGYLNGELAMTVAGLDKVISTLGIDKLLAPDSGVDASGQQPGGGRVTAALNALDRMVPGLGDIARKKASTIGAAAIGMLGQPTTLEGRPAQSIALRFVDGAIMLGPLKVAQTSPLF